MNASVAGARMPRLSEGCGTADTILVVEAHDEALAAARRIFERRVRSGRGAPSHRRPKLPGVARSHPGLSHRELGRALRRSLYPQRSGAARSCDPRDSPHPALTARSKWDLTCVVTDPAKLVEVVAHLVTNAIKFTQEGEVRVRVTLQEASLSSGRQGPALVCAVQDTGPGIAPEQLDAIFEEFRQLNGSPARRHEGMGLGLSLCREMVSLLQGDLSVDTVLGKGTTFTVRVPVSGRSDQATDDAPRPEEHPAAFAGGAPRASDGLACSEPVQIRRTA